MTVTAQSFGDLNLLSSALGGFVCGSTCCSCCRFTRRGADCARKEALVAASMAARAIDALFLPLGNVLLLLGDHVVSLMEIKYDKT